MSLGALLFVGLATIANPKNYTIDTSQTTQEVKAGGNGTLHLQIIPANGFKVSPEAPLKINLSAEGLKLNQSALGHDDAKDKKSTSPEFGVKFGAPEQGGKSIQVDATFFVCDDAKDKKSTSPEFGVKFGAPEQGGKSIQVDATFFVCDEKICERKQEKLSVAIDVKP